MTHRDPRKPRMGHAKRMTIVNAIFLFVVIIVILQLWLLTVTVNSYLGGNLAVVWPAALVSLACLGLNVGLLRYLYRLE